MELSEICYCLKILYNLQELKKKISEYLTIPYKMKLPKQTKSNESFVKVHIPIKFNF